MNPEKPFVPSAPDPTVAQAVQAETDSPRYVGVWYRFLARILDGMILGFVGSPFLVTIFFITFKAGLDAGNNGIDTAKLTTQQSLIIGLCSLAYLIITICYQVFFASSKMQGTLGKRILGIKIVDEKGGRITISRAFTRYIATDGLGIPSSLLSNTTNSIGRGIATFFGFLSFVYVIIDASVGGSDSRKRTVHDRIAKTFVVYR